MPVNEFEKQVQQKMDELQLHPSPEVWTGVEKQIRKEKRRRRIILFWWLFPLLLVGSGGAYLAFNRDGKPDFAENKIHNTVQQEVPVKEQDQNKTGLDISQNKTNSNNLTATGDQELQEKGATVNKTLVVEENSRPTGIKKQKSSFTLNNKSFNKPPKSNAIAKEQQLVSAVIPPSTSIAEPDRKQNLLTTSKNTNETLSNTVSGEVNNKTDLKPVLPPATVTQDSVKKDSLLIVATDKVAEPIDSISKPAIVKTKKKKSPWEFGILIKPGLSDTRSGDLFEKSSDPVYATPSQGAGYSFGPLAPPVLIASPQEDYSFAVTAFAEKKLTRKLNLRAGIGYTYLSTRVMVGDQVAATRQVTNDMSTGVVVNSFYQASSSSDTREYDNKFHLVGISGTLSWKLIDKPKFSLSWDNGFSIDRLISTNTLLFDGQLRGYYNDFSAFRKTHLFASSGPSVGIVKGKKLDLALHPFAAYGFTSVLKKSSDLNSHFIQYGVGLKFQFHSIK